MVDNRSGDTSGDVSTHSSGRRAYGGESAADRSSRRRSAIVDAALTAMAQDRWRAATVADVCIEAHQHKRYFYEHFSDLDELSVAVIDLLTLDVANAALDAHEKTKDSPVTVQARAAVSAVVDALGADKRKALVLLGGSFGSPSAHARRNTALRWLREIFVEHARVSADVDIRGDSVALTANAFVIGGTAQAILSWASGELKVSREQLIDDVAALWLTLGAGTADIVRTRGR